MALILDPRSESTETLQRRMAARLVRLHAARLASGAVTTADDPAWTAEGEAIAGELADRGMVSRAPDGPYDAKRDHWRSQQRAAMLGAYRALRGVDIDATRLKGWERDRGRVRHVGQVPVGGRYVTPRSVEHGPFVGYPLTRDDSAALRHARFSVPADGEIGALPRRALQGAAAVVKGSPIMYATTQHDPDCALCKANGVVCHETWETLDPEDLTANVRASAEGTRDNARRDVEAKILLAFKAAAPRDFAALAHEVRAIESRSLVRAVFGVVGPKAHGTLARALRKAGVNVPSGL